MIKAAEANVADVGGKRQAKLLSRQCRLRAPASRNPTFSDPALHRRRPARRFAFAIAASLIAVDANKRRALAGSDDVRPGGDCKGPPFRGGNIWMRWIRWLGVRRADRAEIHLVSVSAAQWTGVHK
jgi:hypothetical protein